MHTDSLDQLRTKARKPSAACSLDWVGYMQAAEVLFARFETALRPLLAEGTVHIERGQSGIETIDGPQPVPVLLIRVGAQKLQVRLRGIVYSLEKGRADIIGPLGTHRLVYEPPAEATEVGEWYVLGSDLVQGKALTQDVIPGLVNDILAD